MDKSTSGDRRFERRLRYNWPVWFTDERESDRVFQGQMVDINSSAAAFTCRTHEGHPRVDQRLTARFGVPRYGEEEAFEMIDVVREGHVHRVEQPNPFVWRVVMQFHQPLPFSPGHHQADGCVTDRDLEPLLV